MSPPFGATRGGNGTYRLGYPETFKELNIDFLKIGDIGWGTIDVRVLALLVNNRKSITEKFVRDLRSKILNKKINIILTGTTWKIQNPSSLKI